MTGVKLKEQYVSYLPLLQTLNNISVIMLLRTFNIISLTLDTCKGDYGIPVGLLLRQTTIILQSVHNKNVHIYSDL